jgi:hypothetical protein
MPQRIAVILTCGLLIAACGSSSKPGTSASAGDSQAFEFARCMRSHGVPDYSDPTVTGGGVINKLGTNPQSPAFQAAQRACRRLMPAGGPSSGHASARAIAQALKISQCMRAHSISSFPDPTTSPPSDFTGYSAVVSEHGAVLAIPSSIREQSPAFKHAAAACNFGPRVSQAELAGDCADRGQPARRGADREWRLVEVLACLHWPL